MKIQDWKKNNSIVMTTCYEAWSARILADSPVDAVLVGDSAAMVVHGHNSTLPIDVATMAQHVAAVSRGLNGKKFIVGDMPFMSFRKELTDVMTSVEELMKAGAHSIKLEGARGNEALVKHIVQSGVPVMGHLGLTPQSVHGLGGYRVQGRSKEVADQLIEDALILQEQGCFALVLECVPSQLAQQITEKLSIPTIGIGAGPHCDGQILVLHDLLGLSGQSYKFVRPFAQGEEWMKQALNAYASAVKSNDFPSIKESFE